MPTILPTLTPGERHAAVQAAASLLRAGELVALPTETVYGLAANAFNTAAVEKIFAVKGRPTHNPIIVHVASLEMARVCAGSWPPAASQLAQAFWPGPLTLVLPKSALVPDAVTAGGSTVGIRWPNHPVMDEVIRQCEFPLAAPSANMSGQVSPTTAEHVRRGLGDAISLIVDGGSAEVGIESTVVDLSVAPARLLRPGMIHLESMAAVIGPVDFEGSGKGGALRSPGLLLKHYAPQAKLVIWNPAAPLLGIEGRPVHLLARGAARPRLPELQVSIMPRHPREFAKALYSELHRCDEAGAAVILVEAVPQTGEWRAVADRLRRAAAA
jgi:L-threonylcarbamoyladenylate synthase